MPVRSLIASRDENGVQRYGLRRSAADSLFDFLVTSESAASLARAAQPRRLRRRRAVPSAPCCAVSSPTAYRVSTATSRKVRSSATTPRGGPGERARHGQESSAPSAHRLGVRAFRVARSARLMVATRALIALHDALRPWRGRANLSRAARRAAAQFVSSGPCSRASVLVEQPRLGAVFSRLAPPVASQPRASPQISAWYRGRRVTGNALQDTVLGRRRTRRAEKVAQAPMRSL